MCYTEDDVGFHGAVEVEVTHDDAAAIQLRWKQVEEEMSNLKSSPMEDIDIIYKHWFWGWREKLVKRVSSYKWEAYISHILYEEDVYFDYTHTGEVLKSLATLIQAHKKVFLTPKQFKLYNEIIQNVKRGEGE